MPLDRLSTLIGRFDLAARPLADGDAVAANLLIVGADGGPATRIDYWPDPARAPATGLDAAAGGGGGPGWRVAARIDLGGGAEPLGATLPARLRLDVGGNRDLEALAGLIAAEARAPRCGGGIAFTRLCEVLLIQMLRHAIDRGLVRSGMLAGLAHPQLARAVVALHDDPAHDWSIEDLARLAGMSRSRFMAAFHAVMAETPMRYLRRWRMQAARRDLARGGRVGVTARRYGYRSAEAFSRAFAGFFGEAPSQVRRETADLS